jgi:uncharacterized heparinase superfamily protein
VNLVRYFHTLRYLRPIQVYGRAQKYVRRPRLDFGPAPPLRTRARRWIDGPPRKARLLAPGRFEFLNEQRELHWPNGWSDQKIHLLWLFNLHYFEDLIAENAAERGAWHRQLMADWVRDNGRSLTGPAWEPYVVSVRATNWIKWTLAGASLSDEAVVSLAQQIRYLEQRIEIHLLGNHLLMNAKALIFAGLFFSGEEAQRWLTAGLKILAQQLPEQILADGGHYELSPMYHALVLEDLLDLLNLLQVYPAALPSGYAAAPDSWRELVARMMSWLTAMTFPDGQIALFNDAAWGIAPLPSELYAYAERLGLQRPSEPRSGITPLVKSGYVRVATGAATAILDVGEIGPSFLPGHGHADVLTFELALGAERLIVNSGTSVYQGNLPERHRQRQTAAHNTVVVDGEDSSEVWDNFRVARRAHPCGLKIEEQGSGMYVIECSHTGYKRLSGRVVHRRQWRVGPSGMMIEDWLTGRFHRAEARFHLHPRVAIEQPSAREVPWKVGNFRGGLSCTTGDMTVRPATFHPEFGLSLPNLVLISPVGESASHELRW